MPWIIRLTGALLTPWGRISALPYAALSLLVVTVHVALKVRLAISFEDLPVYNPLATALIWLIWVQFCLVSRRLHDSGVNGFILLPLAVIAAAVYLNQFETAKLFDSDFLEERQLAERAALWVKAVELIGIVLMGYAAIRAGEEGSNVYGLPFGAPRASAALSARGSADDEPAPRAKRSPEARLSRITAPPVDDKPVVRKQPPQPGRPPPPQSLRGAGFGRR
ncbi:MAG: DUF805 domain-containing protein [Hyphomicrobium sp.]